MATTAALSCWDHYANGSLTVTGFKIILLAWRQVIKLNFQPVDHMKVAKDGWIKRAMGRGALRGKRSRAPFSVKTRPDHPASCSPLPPQRLGEEDAEVHAQHGESRKTAVPELHHLWNLWAAVQPRATAEHKHITGIFSDFSFGAADTMYFADCHLFISPGRNGSRFLATRHITSEQSQWEIGE